MPGTVLDTGDRGEQARPGTSPPRAESGMSRGVHRPGNGGITGRGRLVLRGGTLLLLSWKRAQG